jgi:DNA-binding NarL/FixJ family response regulator
MNSQDGINRERKARMEQLKLNIVRLYAVEEDDIYREIYRTILPSRGPIELLEVTSSSDIAALRQAVLKLSPDVVLLSIEKPDVDIIRELEQIRIDCPKLGIILMLEECNSQDIRLVRKLALRGNGGMALFMKQSLSQIDRLCKAIPAVSQGQLILDLPLATFIFAEKPESHILKLFTPRELEILNLLAQGDTNIAIAQTLFIDIKTVEGHLNSMYAKFKEEPEFSGKHLRVSAAKLYLDAMGEFALKGDMVVRS